MAQRAQYIDLTRTYLPIDPISMPENLTTADAENSPEKRIPVMAYEGYNFMPTAGGYRSYFGLNTMLNIGALPDLCDYILVYQRQDYSNFFVALCADGIWTNQGTAAEEWTQAINETTASTVAAYLPWSYCVIGEVLYMYRQGDATYFRIQPDAATISAVNYAAYEVTPITPTHLTMAAQMGIFKAGGRLGFWDSDNSVAWSAFEDLIDFVPAIKTQANLTKFVDVVGRITTIKQHGDGFIIYATKSIVHVRKDLSNTFLWVTNVLFSAAGVAYARQVAFANPDTLHYAWTSTGLIKVEDGKVEIIGTELYDYLTELHSPILLTILQGRYVFLQILDGVFEGSPVSVYTSFYPSTTAELASAVDARRYLVSGEINIPPITVAQLMNSLSDTANLGAIASADYRIAGKVWPEYTTAVIPGYLTFDPGTPAVPLFATPATSGGTDPTYTLYGGYEYVPDIPALVYAGFPSPASLITGLTTSPFVGPPSPTNNVTGGTQVVMEGGFDVFFKAEAAWQLEMDWMNDFLDAIGNNVDAYEPVMEESASLAPAAALALLGTVTETDEVSFYAPETLGPSHYELKNDIFSMSKPVTSYNKFDITKVETYGSDIASGVWTYTEQVFQGYSGSFSSYGEMVAFAIARQGGDPPVGQFIVDSFDGINGSGHWTNNLHFVYSLDSATVNKTTTYSKKLEMIRPPVDQLYYRMYIPPVYKTYAVDNVTIIDSGDPVPADDTRIFGSSWSVRWPTIGSGAAPIMPILNPATGLYGGGGTYTGGTVGTAAHWDYINGVWTFTPASGHVAATDFSPNTGVVNGFYQAAIWYTYPATPAITITFPSGSFLMQSGNPAPAYPDFSDAFVYDQQYKRWGRLHHPYKVLYDFTPINTQSDSIVPYTAFGVEGGLLIEDGAMYSFDASPSDSYIKWGKIGASRLGETSLEEVAAQFRLDSTGSLETETSLDGKAVNTLLSWAVSFANVKMVELKKGVVGKWHNITLRGQYDVVYLEYRSFVQGRR